MNITESIYTKRTRQAGRLASTGLGLGMGYAIGLYKTNGQITKHEGFAADLEKEQNNSIKPTKTFKFEGTGAPGLPIGTKSDAEIPYATLIQNEKSEIKDLKEAGPFFTYPHVILSFGLLGLCLHNLALKNVYKMEKFYRNAGDFLSQKFGAKNTPKPNIPA